mmetsp:Transcript_18700/g.63047  ORF Transcript_18700/g.63047 Transcript_18700/m.63047 type:complete len:244 (+) Transcript_18700:760-1491(+)
MCHRYRRPDSLSRPRHAGQRRAARAAAAGAAHARRRPRPRHGGWVRRGCALRGSPLRPPRRPHRGGRTRGALHTRLCGRGSMQLPCPLPRGGRRRYPLYGAPLRVEAAGDGTVAAAAAAAAARRGSARPSRRRCADAHGRQGQAGAQGARGRCAVRGGEAPHGAAPHDHAHARRARRARAAGGAGGAAHQRRAAQHAVLRLQRRAGRLCRRRLKGPRHRLAAAHRRRDAAEHAAYGRPVHPDR